MTQIKILVIGDAGVGKTTFLTRLRTGEFTKNYIATLGVEHSRLTFQTNKGTVTLLLAEHSGQEKFSPTKYDPETQGVLLMFDNQSRLSYKNAYDWARTVKAQLPATVPLVLCGNKVDIPERKVKPVEIVLHRELGCQYYDLSAKSNYNFEKPFLHLIQEVMGSDTNFSETTA